MGLDNVAVHWPRTGRFYDPVAPAEFVDFGEVADAPDIAAPTAALAGHIAKTGTVRATAYTELVDLLLGLRVSSTRPTPPPRTRTRSSTRTAAPGSPAAWRRFVEGPQPYGDLVTFDTVSAVMQSAVADGRLAEQQLRWLEQRLAGMRDEAGGRRTGASPAPNSPCCPASTAAAPTGASPSSPTSDVQP